MKRNMFIPSLHDNHVTKSCKVLVPKAQRPNGQRRSYSVADAFSVTKQHKHFEASFLEEGKGTKKQAERAFLQRMGGMKRTTLNSLHKKVALYLDNPPKHGHIGKRKRSKSIGSGSKATTLTPRMCD